MASVVPTSRALDRRTWRRFDVHCCDGDALRARGAALTSRGFVAERGRDKGGRSSPRARATSRGTAEERANLYFRETFVTVTVNGRYLAPAPVYCLDVKLGRAVRVKLNVHVHHPGTNRHPTRSSHPSPESSTISHDYFPVRSDARETRFTVNSKTRERGLIPRTRCCKEIEDSNRRHMFRYRTGRK